MKISKIILYYKLNFHNHKLIMKYYLKINSFRKYKLIMKYCLKAKTNKLYLMKKMKRIKIKKAI